MVIRHDEESPKTTTNPADTHQQLVRIYREA